MNFLEQVRTAVIVSLVFLITGCLPHTFRRIEDDVASNVVGHSTTFNRLQCADLCGHQSLCDAWKYFEETKTCHLFEKMTTFKTFDNTSDSTPGVYTYMVSISLMWYVIKFSIVPIVGPNFLFLNSYLMFCDILSFPTGQFVCVSAHPK